MGRLLVILPSPNINLKYQKDIQTMQKLKNS